MNNKELEHAFQNIDRVVSQFQGDRNSHLELINNLKLIQQALFPPAPKAKED